MPSTFVRTMTGAPARGRNATSAPAAGLPLLRSTTNASARPCTVLVIITMSVTIRMVEALNSPLTASTR